MIVKISMQEITYQLDTAEVINIAIPVKFNALQPNHFGADIATKQPLIAGDFIGDTKRGGSCNVDSITMVPHCNGTHTETVSHIVHQQFNIGENLDCTLVVCRLISVQPVATKDTLDAYLPELTDSDKVIDLNSLKQCLSQKNLNQIEALVIRTLPNSNVKLGCTYGETNQPPFFTHEAMSWLSQSPIKHLLVDIPSVDKMYDDGLLSNHHIFWQVDLSSRLINDNTLLDRTITEMIYVEDSIVDGLYCLNLQMPAFELDAAPSRPLLYPIKQLTN